MKHSFVILLVWTLCGQSSFAQDNQLYEGPLGDTWNPKTQIVIPAEGITLKRATTLTADEIILKGPIVTNGHALFMESKSLVFEEAGKIIGFSGPAPRNNYVDASLINTRPAGDCTWSGDRREDQGLTGPMGQAGLNGHPSPQPIDVFTGRTEGPVAINGNGQQGGEGGKGGTGGKGQRGCKGADGHAKVHCWARSEIRDGGDGGTAGPGGYGGKGGPGGRGGKNIEVTLTIAEHDYLESWALTSVPGLGGEGGQPGDNGQSGDRGPRGNGHRAEKECFLGGWPLRVKKKKVAEARAGNEGDQLHLSESLEHFQSRKGEAGQSWIPHEDLVTIKSYEDLYKEKYKVFESAYEFHWERLLNVLFQDTLRVSLQISQTRESLSEMSAPDLAQILLLADSDYLKKVAADWHNFFIIPLNKMKQQVSPSSPRMGVLLRRYDLAQRFQLILEKLSKNESNLVTVSQEIRDIMNREKSAQGETLRTFHRKCVGYLRQLQQKFPETTMTRSYFVVPICQNIDQLLASPLSELILAETTPAIVEGEFEGETVPIKRRLDKNGRELAQEDELEVIILHNRRYRSRDFSLARPHPGMELNENGAIVSYKTPTEQNVGRGNLLAYLRSLALGYGQ